MTRKSFNPKTNQPYKVLWFGDLVNLSGFGRIGNEIARRLKQRGWDVHGASISYTGWPHELPFWVWPLGGHDIWNGLVTIANQLQPDVIVSCQDFPYHQTIYHGCRLDFSRLRWVWITPIDGTPIHPDWVQLADVADGCMVISRFGVEALRQAGKRVALCHPGVDTGELYPAEADERAALRAKLGYAPDDFVVGVVCMNQGRKAIPPMLVGFHEFARDKPNARLYLDMDRVSPAGWDVPNLLRQMGWTEAEQARVKYREDAFRADMGAFAPLRNRYALMDAHMVISHREGFGLPLLESMACRIPTLALDWCSGTEIVGEGRGFLVNRIPYMEHGTWGGALDAFPDVRDLAAALKVIYEFPKHAAAVAEAGYQWAIQQTWDVATDQAEAVITAALARDRKDRPSHEPTPDQPNPAPGLSDTYGPGGRAGGPIGPAAAQPVGGDPVVQRPATPDPLPEVAGADAGRGGGDGAAGAGGNPGPG